jgi:hypothetical protein
MIAITGDDALAFITSNQSNLVALASLIVAASSFVWQRKTNNLQERLTRIEEDRRAEEARRSAEADVRLRMICRDRRDGKQSNYLLVENRGQATAKNVTIEEIRPQGNSSEPFTFYESLFPLAELYAGSELTALVNRGTGSTRIYDVRVSWDGPGGRMTRTHVVNWAC